MRVRQNANHEKRHLGDRWASQLEICFWLTATVFGKQRVSFKAVFDAAQVQLMKKFGMEMVPLASKEKVTLKDRLSTIFLEYL